MKLKKILEKKREDKELELNFNRSIVMESSKRLLFLLYFAAIMELLILALIALNLWQWGQINIILQVSLIIGCLVFAAIIFVLRKHGKIKSLSFIMTLMHIIAFIFGGYFCILLYEWGGTSYSVYLLVLYLVSITFVRKHHVTLFLYFLSFIAITMYIAFKYDIGIIIATELINVSFFVIIISMGSVFTYKRNRQLIVQEMKIKEINEKLEHLSITDELTGLYNRRKIYEVFEKEIAISLRYERPLSIILLDIDRFKTINDTFGHNTGDIVLKELSSTITEALRSSDIIGRWGGEEFIIICPFTASNTAVNLAERLRIMIENLQIMDKHNVTFCAGVSQFRTEDAPIDIVARADEALYLAKHSGRNCVKTIG